MINLAVSCADQPTSWPDAFIVSVIVVALAAVLIAFLR